MSSNISIIGIHSEVADKKMISILKNKTPGERLAIANDIWISARKLVACGLRSQYPEWDEATVMREVVKRFVYGTH